MITLRLRFVVEAVDECLHILANERVLELKSSVGSAAGCQLVRPVDAVDYRTRGRRGPLLLRLLASSPGAPIRSDRWTGGDTARGGGLTQQSRTGGRPESGAGAALDTGPRGRNGLTCGRPRDSAESDWRQRVAGEERRRARAGHAEAELRLRWLRLECEQMARRRVDVHSVLLAQCHRFVVRLEVARIYKYEIYVLK